MARRPPATDPAYPAKGQTRKPQAADVEIGRLLAEARARADLNQTDVGEHLGISQQQLGKYEKGESSLKVWMLIKAARFLGVEPVDMLRSAEAATPGFAEAAALGFAEARAPFAHASDGHGDASVEHVVALLRSAISELEAVRGSASATPPRRPRKS